MAKIVASLLVLSYVAALSVAVTTYESADRDDEEAACAIQTTLLQIGSQLQDVKQRHRKQGVVAQNPGDQCLDSCSHCQNDHDSCLWDFDHSQVQDFDTFNCDLACFPHQDHTEAPCLDRCWHCQDNHDSCLWDFDQSQVQDFDTFNCDLACFPQQAHQTETQNPGDQCLDSCSHCQNDHDSCLWDFDQSQAQDFDTFDCNLACFPPMDHNEAPCLHRCMDCLMMHDSCLWDFDESQVQEFDTFDCNRACANQQDSDSTDPNPMFLLGKTSKSSKSSRLSKSSKTSTLSKSSKMAKARELNKDASTA